LNQTDGAGNQRQFTGQIFLAQRRRQLAEGPEGQQIPDVSRCSVIVDQKRLRPLGQWIDVPVRETIVFA
jgi:hypothetical protein